MLVELVSAEQSVHSARHFDRVKCDCIAVRGAKRSTFQIDLAAEVVVEYCLHLVGPRTCDGYKFAHASAELYIFVRAEKVLRERKQ